MFYFSWNKLQLKRMIYTTENLQDYFNQVIQTNLLGKDYTILGFNFGHTISTQGYIVISDI